MVANAVWVLVGAGESACAGTDVCCLRVSKWPSGSSNGYAYYHRVDQVNGGDQNATHTTGFGKKIHFWYH